MKKPQFFYNFMWYRNEMLALNELILHTNVACNSKHLRGKKNGGWMCPSIWKLDFTHSSIRIDYISPSQSTQAALRVPEPTKMLKKN